MLSNTTVSKVTDSGIITVLPVARNDGTFVMAVAEVISRGIRKLLVANNNFKVTGRRCKRPDGFSSSR